MNLLIISHTSHYQEENTIKGWGATIREISHLASLFDEVVHIAPLHNESLPPSSLPYSVATVVLRQVQPSGGQNVWKKLGILLRVPSYIFIILKELRKTDAIHIRCPANISLIAILLLMFVDRPQTRWIKYAGNWGDYANEPFSYKLQKWWLKKFFLHRGQVTVNGIWENQAQHIHSFFNPCLTDDELEEGKKIAENKQLSRSLKLIFVGRTEDAKGLPQCLKIVDQLRNRGISAQLDVIGDSNNRHQYEKRSQDMGIADQVFFHGWLSRSALGDYYAKAHLILLPSATEGWPKVLSEAMAYGVVPIASRVGSISLYLEQFRTGQSLESDDIMGFVTAVLFYIKNPTNWKDESINAVQNARFFTYSHYLAQVESMLQLSMISEQEDNSP